MSDYRHEYKYIVDAAKEALIHAAAKCVLNSDSHAGEDGTYLIRSLYFDDAFDSCMRENEIGSDPRWKYRIRYYDNDLSYINLEKKSKVNGMTNKTSCRLTADEVRLLSEGKGHEILNSLMAECQDGQKSPDRSYGTKMALISELVGNGLLPKVIVTYEREPFVYAAGNVRVTFDRNISSSTELDRFLSGDYRVRPVMPTGRSVLEVKWDEVLPKHIKDSLLVRGLIRTAYSKYYMCRQYH